MEVLTSCVVFHSHTGHTTCLLLFGRYGTTLINTSSHGFDVISDIISEK